MRKLIILVLHKNDQKLYINTMMIEVIQLLQILNHLNFKFVSYSMLDLNRK